MDSREQPPSGLKPIRDKGPHAGGVKHEVQQVALTMPRGQVDKAIEESLSGIVGEQHPDVSTCKSRLQVRVSSWVKPGLVKTQRRIMLCLPG